jgi:hypothetical protein
MNLHAISLKRLLTHWAGVFACAYVASLFLYTLFQMTGNAFVYILLQASSPLLYLLFAWLYFRKAAENNWPARFLVAGVWIALSLLGSAVLMQPVYGYDWTAAINLNVLQGQLINVAAILVGGWVGRRG